VRVVIADDHLLVREGVASLLRRAAFEVVAEASSGDELLSAIDAHRPDVALVDVRMPPTHTEEGLRAAQEIRARHPEIGIVILSVAGAPAQHNGAGRNGLPQGFRCDVVNEGARVRIAPVGELDMASTPRLAQAIRELRQAGAAHLIIDLRRVTFIDSTGLRLALDLDDDARDDGLRLELLAGPPEVQRIFDVTGTLDQLPFVTPDPRH
jgi:anti-anti-sigma factor